MSGVRSVLSCEQATMQPDRSGGQEGQSIAELALLFPVLLLIMIGVLDLGRAFFAYTTVVNAAREGARYAAFHPTDSVGIRARVEQEAEGWGVDLTQSTVRIDADAISPGIPIRVTVIHKFEPVTRIITGGLDISITGSVSMIQF